MNEDPTDDDIDRFSAETGHCPDCGEEIWDEAWQCPHCESVVEGRIERTPTQSAGRQVSRRSAVVMVLVLIAILMFVLL